MNTPNDNNDTTSPALHTVPAAEIIRGDNDRHDFNAADLAELAASIGANGIAQPPTVRPLPSGGYQIVAGERRCRAMIQVLRWTEIPVIVRQLTDLEADAIMLVENLNRSDLNPIEEAAAYQKRLDGGIGVAALSQQTGKSEAMIRSRLALLRLVPEAQHLVATRQLTPASAGPLVPLDSNRQNIALRAHRDGLNVHEMRALCTRLKNDQDSEPMFNPDNFLQVAEYAAEAKAAAVPSRKTILHLARRLTEAVAATNPTLAVEARSILARV